MDGCKIEFQDTFKKKGFKFFANFWPRLAYKFVTSANTTPKIFVTNNFNMGIKKRRIWFRCSFVLITFFNGFEINIKFCVFWYPYQNVVKKILVGSYKHFLPTLNPNAHKTAKKMIFFQMWIRINSIFQFWFLSYKGLKSFHLKFSMQNLWKYYSSD